MKKRQTLLASSVHLVEIDLLRAHPAMPMGNSQLTDYQILVSDATHHPQADLYSFNLRDRIPSFPLPLKPEDAPLMVDLYPILQQVYDQGSFDLRIDYTQPLPKLVVSDQAWLTALLTSRSSQ